MAELGFNVVRLGVIWKGLEPGRGPINERRLRPRATQGHPGPERIRRRGLRRLHAATRGHHLAAGPQRDLFPHRHAPGRLQRGIRRGGGPQLGRVHRRHHPEAETEHRRLEWQLHRPRGGRGLRPLLGQRRGGEPPGGVRHTVDQDRRPFHVATRGSSATTPSTSPMGPDSAHNPTARRSTPCSSASTPAGPIPGLDQIRPTGHLSDRRSGGRPDPPDRGGGPHPSGRLRGQLRHRLGGAEPHRADGLPPAGTQFPRLLLPARPQRPGAGQLRLRSAAPSRATSSPSTPKSGPTTPQPDQPDGPGWLLTEFGATTDTADLARITSDAAANLVGWIYWQWIDYDDPTGSHSSALWPPRAATASQLNVLSETYRLRGGRDTHLHFL